MELQDIENIGRLSESFLEVAGIYSYKFSSWPGLLTCSDDRKAVIDRRTRISRSVASLLDPVGEVAVLGDRHCGLTAFHLFGGSAVETVGRSRTVAMIFVLCEANAQCAGFDRGSVTFRTALRGPPSGDTLKTSRPTLQLPAACFW